VSGQTDEATGYYAALSSLPGRDNSHRASKLVGNLGLVFTGIQDVAIRANWTQGYRYPTVMNLFTGTSPRGAGSGNTGLTTLPNPNLKPETSNSFEVGARYLSGGWNVDAAFFYTVAKNYIDSDGTCQEAGIVCPAPPNNRTNITTYINRDSRETLGAELAAAYTFLDLRLTPYMNLTQMRRVNVDKQTGARTRAALAPTKGRFGLRWETDIAENMTFYTDAYGVWSSKIPATGTGTSAQPIANWMTGNLTVGVEGGEAHKYNVSLNVRNVADRLYRTRSGGSYAYGRQLVLGAGFDW
jgi:hemoglobin/transferrin/lactoferrin receptor protein